MKITFAKARGFLSARAAITSESTDRADWLIDRKEGNGRRCECECELTSTRTMLIALSVTLPLLP
jgi:hypothetical protein